MRVRGSAGTRRTPLTNIRHRKGIATSYKGRPYDVVILILFMDGPCGIRSSCWLRCWLFGLFRPFLPGTSTLVVRRFWDRAPFALGLPICRE